MKKLNYIFALSAIVIAAMMLPSCRKAGQDIDEPTDEPRNEDATGVLPGVFSIASGKTVHFAQGNLMAKVGKNAASLEWGLPENQYDVAAVEDRDEYISHGVMIDLFGWVGSSASSKYTDTYGALTEEDEKAYGDDPSDECPDWGGLIAKGWRVLSADEWEYLLHERKDAQRKLGLCQIVTAKETVNGLLLLPDDWKGVEGFEMDTDTDTFVGNVFYAGGNAKSGVSWEDMEEEGAVFLPVTGLRFGDEVKKSAVGHYWTASPYERRGIAYNLDFAEGFIGVNNNNRYFGFAVRLVCETRNGF